MLPNLKRGFVTFVLASAALLVSGSSSRAQTTPPTQPTDSAPKQSIVRGRVIYDDTRRPLRRVQVSIYDPAAKNRLRSYYTWTDGRGEFQIKNVPAGKYFVVVDAPGIIRSSPYGSENQDETFTSATVDGVSKSEVVVRVRHGAAFSGRVTYTDGDGVIGATIKVLRKKNGKWTPVFVGSGSNDRVLTDERGVYRVSGLVPGDYIVGAAEQKWGIELSAQDRADGGNLLNRAVMPATFYGGAATLGGATTITLEAGNEQKDIDIVLADLPLNTVSGTITLKGKSHPVGRARISLRRKDETSGFETDDLEDRVTNADEDGRFTFDEVPNGVYRMTVSPPRWFSRTESAPTNQQMGPRYVAKSLEINVSGTDLLDLAIDVSSGSRISGTVTVEGGKPLPPQLAVYVMSNKSSAESPASVRVNQDGTFSINGAPPGPAYLRTSVPLENRYYTKSVMVGKSDLRRGPVTVKEDEDLTDVRIVISPDAAVFEGRVLASDGKTPRAGINVALIPTDPEEIKSNYQLFGITNADGGVRMTGAPGEYLAIVLPRGEYDYRLQAEALKLRYPNAQRVVLQPGENPKVDLVSNNQ